MNQDLRNALLIAIIVCGNLAGNLLLKVGMQHSPGSVRVAPVAYVQALVNVWVVAGVLLLLVALGSQLALLSRADLSYVAPITSIGYVLTAFAGKVLLDEPLAAPRWAAVLLISGGVALVSRTPALTVRRA